MPLLDPQAGVVAFEDGFCLTPYMPASALSERYAALRNRDVFLDAHPAAGGSLAPICFFQEGALVSVTLYVHDAAGAERPAADRQRALLLRSLRLKDPCPDTQGSLRVRFPFGEVFVSTDPHTGQAAALIRYASRCG